MKIKILITLVLLLTAANCAFAQTTGFTYQGRLTDAGMAASGNYDFQFGLFSAAGGGTQIGSPLTRTNVVVASGVFTVQLDFGAGAFPGAARFLEIGVRAAGGGSFTTLLPRQQITASSYGIRSLSAATADTATNAAQLGGVAANQYVVTTDPRMTDARDPLPGSVRYVQNGMTPQSASNFNITGDGTAGGTLSGNAVNSTTQYNVNGQRVLSIEGVANTFAGISAGASSTGNSNSFFGYSAGGGSTNSGNANSFFGERSGALNTTGVGNSFFGSAAGVNNTSGMANSFFGLSAGQTNTAGASNSYFGSQAGFTNSSGNNNSFFGRGAGVATTASNNSFFGFNAGQSNTTGSNNILIGAGADVASNNLTNATAIGAGVIATSSNSIRLGRMGDELIVPGFMRLLSIFGGGTTSLCWSAGNISSCASSLRYKTEVEAFTEGLDIVRRLRPIAFTWKDGRVRDVGFAAEEVEQIEPLLTTYSDKGEIEGVKYGQITTVLVNAVQQQQRLIEQQQKQIDEQRRQIERLRQFICLTQPNAELCK